MDFLTSQNWLALCWFISAWLLLEYLIDFSTWREKGLSYYMSRQRAEWLLASSHRDIRMIDTQLLMGQQAGATFFGSACILATGASISLLSATDNVIVVYRDLATVNDFSRQFWELRVLGLAVIFVYAFFKFAWSYRLFSYCGILLGAIPNTSDTDEATREKAANAAAKMNVLAGRHFTAGLRAIFFALAYLGWFISDTALLVSTVFVLSVLIRRQYFSKARDVLIEKEEANIQISKSGKHPQQV